MKTKHLIPSIEGQFLVKLNIKLFQVSLKEWMQVDDTGTELLNWVIEKEKTDISPEWKKLIMRCLAPDVSERMSVTNFLKKLKKVSVG